MNNRVTFPRSVNVYLQNLIQKMLEKDPEKRITMEEIRSHTWVTKAGTNPLPNQIENIQVTPEEVSQAIKRARSISAKVITTKIKK